MQQTGTLKKRKRRNIAKVQGLSTVPYSEVEDNFDYNALFPSSASSSNGYQHEHGLTYSTQHDVRIRISRTSRDIITRAPTTPFTRVTRDPSFHVIDVEGSARGSLNGGDDISFIRRISKLWHNADKDSIAERQYFLDKATVTRVRQILWLGIVSGTFPWRWNSREHRIDKWGSTLEKMWDLVNLLISIQTVFLTGFQIYSFFVHLEDQIETYRVVFMNFVNIVVYVCAVLFDLNMYLYKDEMREYINTLFRFNNELVEKYLVSLEGYSDGGRIVINLSIPSNMSQVLARTTLFLTVPFHHAYLFSYIYPKPWFWLIPGAIHEFVLLGRVLTNYTFYQWIMVAHSNSLEFWLQEMHCHNESDYTRDEIRQPKAALETYRAMQVLTNCFNGCMAPMSIPLMKGHVFGALVPCGYVFIRSLNHYFIDEFPGIISFPICIIDTVTTGFCTMALASHVCDLASGFVDSWSRTRNKDFRRTLMSFGTLKVKVARFYFVTVATTITFFKSAADFIINCIITFP